MNKIFLMCPEKIYECSNIFQICKTAVEYDNILSFLAKYEWDNIYKETIDNKRNDVLMYLINYGKEIKEDDIKYAILVDNVDSFSIFYEKKASNLMEDADIFEEILSADASNCFEYIIRKNDLYIDVKHICDAIAHGALECFKKCENSIPIPAYIHTRCAARYGKLNILQYMHENNYPWDHEVILEAFANKNYDCLKYAILNGCEIFGGDMKNAVRSNVVGFCVGCCIGSILTKSYSYISGS